MSLLSNRPRTAIPSPGPSTAPAPSPSAPPRSSVAAFSVAHRWWVIVVATLLLGGSVVLLSSGLATTPQDQQLVGDSARAEAILAGSDVSGPPTETVVATAREGALAPERALALGAELAAAYRGVEGVAAVGAPVPGADGRSVVVPVELAARTSPEETSLPKATAVVGPSLAVTARLAGQYPQLTIGQVGPASIGKEFDDTLGRDFQRAELVSLPITLVVLLVAFGTILAAGVPLVLGMGSVVVALGLTAAVSQHWVTVDPNTQSLVLLIGLAVGVDYALFVLRRSREERAAGASVEDAIVVAGATAGRAVLISGLTVMVAMAGMLVAGGLFTSLAVGTLLVVGVAVFASATVLPAVLAVLGDRVDALRLPFTRRREATRGSVESAWGRLAGRVVAHPLAWAGAAVALLVGLAAPAVGMRTALPGVEDLPKDVPVVAAYRQLQAAAPTEGVSLLVVVKAPADQSERVAAALRSAAGTASGIEHVSGAAPQARTSTDRTVSVLAVGVGLDASDQALPGVVDAVRERVATQVAADLAGTPGVEVHVGGYAAATDLARWMDSRLPWVVGFVLVLALLVMLVSFGSPWLAAATVALNLLSVGAAYGVMTAVFQGTWAEGVLGFTSIGSIASWLPLLMFVVLFGLSMDYHVFVTSRVREARDAGMPPRAAVRAGVARSAGVVTSAAAVMVGVFAVFGTLSVLEMKQLGVGLAVAVLLDATLVRGVLLPATLALLGERAHRGPAWLPRLHH
ncbi:MAG: MMPL family transporter [Dermatophilaceae bacterium]